MVLKGRCQRNVCPSVGHLSNVFAVSYVDFKVIMVWTVSTCKHVCVCVCVPDVYTARAKYRFTRDIPQCITYVYNHRDKTHTVVPRIDVPYTLQGF